MDQPALGLNEHRRALVGLKTANTAGQISRTIFRAILQKDCLNANKPPLRILDVASGGGDVLIGITRLAARRGIEVQAHGWDISSTAVDHARSAAKEAGVSCSFGIHNALVDDMPRDYDIILSTLFLHHLTDEDACALLRRMAVATRQYVIVDDLCRTRLGYLYAWTGVRLLTRSQIVHVDGPLSVRAAYTIAEASQLAREAGLQNARFTRHWPQRFLMTWKR
jgi:2-polyprenyl-3-methyl-5-hydroxy-6-metoxy-1,4-benzoquinol methylase